MKKGNKTLFILIALLAAVGAAIYFLPMSEEQVENHDNEIMTTERPSIEEANIIKVDDQMPTFSVEMTNGETITSESLRGKVVLVNFWATWCPPCREELKRVQADIIDRFAERGLVFIPISRGEDKEKVINFLGENKYMFAVGLDTDQSIFKKFATDYIPRNYLINRHGVVVEATVGYEAEEFGKLLQTIEMTLNAR